MPLSRQIDGAQLGAVLKTALDAVVVMRTDGTIAGWNDVAQTTFGWSFAEAEGKRMSELIIPHRYRAAHEKGLTHYLATGEGPVIDRHIEIEALHRLGHEFPVELSITRTNGFAEPVFLGFLRDISERRDFERRQALMIDELNHRVKNMLGLVGAIAHQTLRSTPTLEAFGPAFSGRLASLGRAHEILTAATWESASLRALVESVVVSLAGKSQVTVHGPEALLSPRQFLSVSMLLHELATNAIKYGALSIKTGVVLVSWTIESGALRLTWRETGSPNVAPPTHQGFGTKLIETSIRHDLQGEAEHRWLSEGLEFVVTFAME